MSADEIARVIADLRGGRQRRLLLAEPSNPALQSQADEIAALSGPTVDATAIYDSLVARDDPVAVYEDHPCIAPPWDSATICYVNEHENVIAMTLCAGTLEDGYRDMSRTDVIADLNTGRQRGSQPEPWEPAEPVDWDRVRWLITALVWVGGRSHGRHCPTGGPAHLWKFAVYDDGTPADLHWVHIVPDYPMERWDMAHLVLLGALNFCNCRNVELIEPRRSRAEARRIARTGVQVHTINVFPSGKSARAAKAEGAMGTPLTSVRGHFSCYGPDYGRGLLFGKYAGRFWIPQHARGDAAVGESKADYVLRSEAS